MRSLLLVFVCIVTGAHAAPPSVAPSALFEGRSQGDGTLRLFGRSRHYLVDNVGHRAPDGSFVLEQRIRMEGEPPRTRTWHIRDAGANRYAFTLSDAAGPGVAQVVGDALQLRYAPRHGVRLSQRLAWTRDGRIDNHGRLRVLGVPIGRVDETITPAAEQVTTLPRSSP